MALTCADQRDWGLGDRSGGEQTPRLSVSPSLSPSLRLSLSLHSFLLLLSLSLSLSFFLSLYLFLSLPFHSPDCGGPAVVGNGGAGRQADYKVTVNKPFKLHRGKIAGCV